MVLSENYSLGGWQGQKKRLVAEGITFLNPNQVDLKKHGLDLSYRGQNLTGGPCFSKSSR